MTNYLAVMNFFLEESSTIVSNNLSDNFDEVITAKLSEEIKPYEQSLKDFKTFFDGIYINNYNKIGRKAVDGEAQNSVPTVIGELTDSINNCLLYTSPSPRD